MQKHRNQGDLLRDPQNHLQKIRGPPGEQSSRAAWARNRHRDHRIDARINRTKVKAEIPHAPKRLPAKCGIVDSSAARDRLGGGSRQATVDSRSKNRQFVSTAI
jgi:hypothetical protein